MGQQQLLLLVLSIVIVGIAIVVGVNAYSENSVKTNWDNMLQDALRIANDAQQWKQKPELFGGSTDAKKVTAEDFSDLDGADQGFTQLGYSPDNINGANSQCYQNLNGIYEITPAATGLTIEGYNVSNQNKVTVVVDGNLESNVDLDDSNADNLVRGGVSTVDATAQTVTAPTCT